MPDPKICILVLNWNGVDDTIECIHSLKKVTTNNSEIVVIDNGSSDDSVQRIRQQFGDVKIIELESNLFYGGGNNAGLDWAQNHDFDYVVFLNNDTTVEPDFLEPLLAGFEYTQGIGGVAPLMCYSAVPELIWYGGGQVNLWTGVVEHLHIRKNVSKLEIKPMITDYITGCCLMMPTKLAVELGGFDLSFKMYGEDVDLSLRARAAGYKLLFVPESKIYHKVSASVGGEFAFSKLKRKLSGLLRIFATHAKWYQWISILLFQLIFSIKYVFIYLKNRTSSGNRAGAES
ncbi:MAG: glycosyltransferase family 2 protein [Candidatus Marinimicrobia bacterium]|jgi:GT2 family glycosyltransferase|nr:glycosyltransferase family 2 protein [Candidatus Neomarinimicrobiota bacterium]MBT4362142.1 glycosyltransferase family 2 protein [Candidatus Neomarinimicrobiota bacterium]MBT4713665.1 glycosyltransferase family 2 protein [Candidatus Neomarinimicrobiota bacterium]MBT4945197.1 glycosyltransferase family 2 protein [Candidatus Neomarinimicrobiota bacterium]MBT5268807.1 glycosyltransferase family 2 protein [Candidatus Neomarinimicrobiota bacterium]